MKKYIQFLTLSTGYVPGSEHTRALAYMYSTNAYKTCKAAIEAAKAKNPAFSYVANFAKD